MAWSKKAPETDDELWCWVEYEGRYGISRCPARLVYFKTGEYLLSTARNDTFTKVTGGDAWQYLGKVDTSLRFGPIIVEPE